MEQSEAFGLLMLGITSVGLRMSAVDIPTIGAEGRSIRSLDEGGSRYQGPR